MHNVGTQSAITGYIRQSGTLGHQYPTYSLVIWIALLANSVSNVAARSCVQHTSDVVSNTKL